MPELPEVEIIRLGLQRKIIGLSIKDVKVLNPKSFLGRNGQPCDYAQNLRGRKVLKVWRRAKILGVGLDSNSILLFHLKMSGQLVLDDGKRFIGGHPTLDMRDEMPNKSTRVIFEFNDGSKLYFNDQRKFGWIKIIINERLSINNLFKKLGPEPLEKSFTWKMLKQNLLRHKNMPVKVAIMDQGVVSGVGNIYANEACFDAKIDPRTKVGSMDDMQFKKLYKGIIECLKDGMKYGGSSKVHFVNAEGKKGYFLDYAYCYWKEGEKCKVCGTEIKKIQLGGRGTYFCPKCQLTK